MTLASALYRRMLISASSQLSIACAVTRTSSSPDGSRTRRSSSRRWCMSSAGRWTTGIVSARELPSATCWSARGNSPGGYFADPGFKDVPDLDRLGFPIAEVSETGEALLTKLDGSGGALTVRNCKEQILYEVQDPSRYLTPDVTADFSTVRFNELGPDRVHVSGARGAERPMTLKISTGFDAGFLTEGQISYAGPGALPRARLARQILERRLHWIARGDLRMDFIGIDSMHGAALSEPSCEPYEVRLRAAGRFFDENDARRLMHEVESLYVNGPAGGGGVFTSMRENIAMDATFLPRDFVVPAIGFEVA